MGEDCADDLLSGKTRVYVLGIFLLFYHTRHLSMKSNKARQLLRKGESFAFVPSPAPDMPRNYALPLKVFFHSASFKAALQTWGG